MSFSKLFRCGVLALVLSVVAAVLTAHPSRANVKPIGDGTPASCTEQALRDALPGGGLITFDCGGPVTITITQELFFQDYDTEIDGSNQVTLQGTPGEHIIYFRTWGFDAARTLTLRNMTITGASRTGEGEAANGAAIYARSQAADFENDIPTLNIDNVTFTDNHSTQTSGAGNAYDYGGGAIFILGGVLNVTNSTFTNNRADGGAGGAIHGLGSTIRIQDSTFTGNHATAVNASDQTGGYGGALYVDGALFRGNGEIRITGSVFDGNTAVNQGGFAYVNLYGSRSSELRIDSSTFTNNVVSDGILGWGGALAGGGTGGPVPVIVTNSLFANNIADGAQSGGDGGAIALPQTSDATIANSTFVGNRANVACNDDCFSGRGGAMYFSGTYEIINSTIANNHAEWIGGALIGDNGGVLRNTIIANNTAGNKGGTETAGQCVHTLTGGNNIQWPVDGDNLCVNNITIADPLLGALTNGVLPLPENSPAIDAGNNSVCSAAPVNGVDQRGVTRPQGPACDIGAFEREQTAQDLLTNPSFEDELGSEWTVSAGAWLRYSAPAVLDGDYAFVFVGSGSGIEFVEQTVPITGSQGDTVSISGSSIGVLLPGDVVSGSRIILVDDGGTVVDTQVCGARQPAGTGGWTAFSCTVTASADFAEVRAAAGWLGASSGYLGVDDLTLWHTP